MQSTRWARAVVLGLAADGIGAGGVTAQNRGTVPNSSITVSGTFRVVQLSAPRLIASDVVDAGRIGSVTASRDGTIIITDLLDYRLIVIDPSGKRIRSYGGRGSGPGEYQDLTALSWLADTLVVFDRRLLRFTLSLPSVGRTVRTLLWPGEAERPIGMIGMDQTLHAEVWVVPEPIHIPPGFVGRITAPPRVRRYAPIGSTGIGQTLSGIRDSTPDPVGSDCVDRAGTIHILGPMFGNYARARMLTARGELLIADATEYRFAVVRGDSETSIRGTAARRVVSVAVWDSVARNYNALREKHGALTCTPPYERPAQFPAIVSAQLDESGVVWVEIRAQGGDIMQVFGTDGRAIKQFAMPPRDPTVAWFVRNSTLYVVSRDGDGLQGIASYRVP